MEAQKETTAPAIIQQPQSEIAAAFQSAQGFELVQRIAKTMAASDLVPQMYRQQNPQDTKPIANCIIALDMAQRMKANPLMVMQNLYIVHGNPGWSSKFLIATLNNCGRFSPLRYEFKGTENTDEWSCRAQAIDKHTGELLSGSWVSIAMAKKEGWYSKNGSKWQTMPELMMQYRAAAFFQRVYAPEISMGLSTAEEYEDAVVVETIESAQAKVKAEVEQTTQAAKPITIVPPADNAPAQEVQQPQAPAEGRIPSF